MVSNLNFQVKAFNFTLQQNRRYWIVFGKFPVVHARTPVFQYFQVFKVKNLIMSFF